MVCRPIPSKVANDDVGGAGDASGEQKRLADKFAVHRNLVPLVARNNDVLFLNAASAPPSNLIVHEALTRYSAEALYEEYPYGTLWRDRREAARQLVARCIGAESPSTVAFTRDTTEGIGSFLRCLRLDPGDNAVVLDTEHPNLVYGLLALRDDAGIEVRQVPTTTGRDGRVAAADADTLRPYVDARTRVIGISSVSFDSGQRHDLAGICAAFRPRGIHVLADMTQHVGFAAADVRALGVSAAAFSLHKGLNCPTGLGALYVSPATLAALDNPTPPIVSMAAVRNLREDQLVRADEPLDLFPDARRFDHANMSLVAVCAAESFARFYLDVLGPADVEEHLYGLTAALARRAARLGVPLIEPAGRAGRAPHICVLGLEPAEWRTYLADCDGVRLTVNRLGVRVSFGFYSSLDDVGRFVEVLEGGLARGLSVRW
ncbi:PLP-dependent transferase [Hypoxylon sp. FL1284]|nr:PLP-dependent transferase [Hypoxylon sp. FL1284]